MGPYKVIDADGHVRESMTALREFLEPRWQRRNLFPNDAWDRDLRGKLDGAYKSLQRLGLPLLQNRRGVIEIRRAPGAAGPRGCSGGTHSRRHRARRGGRSSPDLYSADARLWR